MAPSAEPLLRAAGLDVGYGRRTVLAGVDLAVRRGEVVALLGPNGSGKSTLIRSVLHLVPPLGGAVALDGADAAGLTPAERARRAAYVPQEESPAFGFTVAEIVLMGRIPFGDGLFETADDHAAARAAMVRAEVAGLADRRLDTLSGGERQRVLVARALAQQAPLLLLDEPTSHLDPGHAVLLGRLLRELAAEGYGVLSAVHDLNWAAATADRIALLDGGHLTLDGPADAVLADPRLDEVYGVAFQRVPAPDGRPRLFPV